MHYFQVSRTVALGLQTHVWQRQEELGQPLSQIIMQPYGSIFFVGSPEPHAENAMRAILSRWTVPWEEKSELEVRVFVSERRGLLSMK